MTRTIIVIGGGAAGALAGIHLAPKLGPTDRLIVVEPAERIGRGIAYSTPFDEHILNVPAGGMSAFEREPDHFLEWLRRTKPEGQGDLRTAFVPRKWFGEYLEELFATCCTRVLGERFVHLRDRAVAVSRDSRWKVRLASGAEVEGDILILATGNSRPNRLYTPGIEQIDPFDRAALSKIGKTERVAILGTGLTMVDAFLALRALGHTGEVTAISRRGLLPLPHGGSSVAGIELGLREKTARGLLRELRQAAKAHVARGGVWQDVMTVLRPRVAATWTSLPERERRRFLRHAKPYWEVHRHRVPVSSAAILKNEIARGRLRVLRGRIAGISKRGHEIELRFEDGRPPLRCDRLIHAMGQVENVRIAGEPLFESLLSQGLARTDALGFGIEPNAEAGLFALGVLIKGRDWETTAIPEIRKQAAVIELT